MPPTTTTEPPEDATEIVNAKLSRADLVKAPAHGQPFVIAKSADGETTVTITPPTTVTITAPTPAEVFGEVAKDAEVETEPVEKSVAEDVHATAVASPKLGDERPSNAPGDPDDPTSAAWEAVDAANARAAVASLVDLKQTVCGLAEREEIEAFTTGDDDDRENAWSLQDATSAIDFALGVLAPFAVLEQAEADDRAEDMVKSVVRPDGGPRILLATPIAKSTEDLAARLPVARELVAKAGRVLSSANETRLREAAESIQKVLATLPQAAPEETAVEKSDETVTDEVVEKAEETAPAETEVVEKADGDEVDEEVDSGMEKAEADPELAVDPVEKAEADPMDSLSGKSTDDLARIALTGADTERAAALQELGLRALTGAVAPGKPEDAQPEAGETDPDVPGQEADDPMTKAEEPPVEADAALAKAIEESPMVKGLLDRIATLEATPQKRRVLTNGAVPPAAHLRGQDEGDAGGPITKSVMERAADLRKELRTTQDATRQKEIADEMQSLAVASLEGIHAARR